jgi:sugar O-acyltransferase (sialic acid O-acetyltransferase NeuD family)
MKEMKEIYILGSSGFAKEVYRLITDINKAVNEPIYSFRGFIDKAPSQDIIRIGQAELKIFDEDEWLLNNKANNIVSIALGIGDPKIGSKVVRKFESFQFPNLIHPISSIDFEAIEIGRGNIITSGVIMTVDIKIGSYNIFNLNVTIGHDCIIGSNNIFNPSVNVSGGIVIGDRNLFGVGSLALQYLKIGSDSILGAGAVLSKDLEDKKLAVGIPAKVIKELLG